MDKNQNGIEDGKETMAHMIYGFGCFAVGTIGHFAFGLSSNALITLVGIGAGLIVEDSLRKVIIKKVL